MIRKAKIEDIPKISDCWAEMVKEMRPEWKPNKKIWSEWAESLLKNSTYTIFIAEINDRIVGFIDGLVFREPSTNKLHGIGQHFYVLPEYRNRFIGSALYKKAVSEALLYNAEALEFFCFPEEIEMWEKRGFRPVRIMMRMKCTIQ